MAVIPRGSVPVLVKAWAGYRKAKKHNTKTICINMEFSGIKIVRSARLTTAHENIYFQGESQGFSQVEGITS
jgi:hypothetical protein